MNFEKYADQVIETDFLVVGGGLAGCPAACKAVEHGLNVTLIEKAAIARSGNAGPGLDHVINYARDGVSTGDMIRGYFGTGRGAMLGGTIENPNTQAIHTYHNLWAFDEMVKLGCTMNWDDGKPYFFPFTGLGADVKRTALRVHWHHIKPELKKAVKEHNVNVLERTTMVDLLTNRGRAVGCTALNTRTGEFIVIKAKATLIASGKTFRIFEPETPDPWKYKMIYHFCPSAGSGDGTGAVYRAGGEISNMEITAWTYRIRDSVTMSYGQFRIGDGCPMKVFTYKGKEIRNPSAMRYLQLEMAGETPIYNSLEELPDDYQKRIEVALADENPVCLEAAEQRMFNPRQHRYELMVHNKSLGFFPPNGIYINPAHETSLKGLFAVGDAATGKNGSTASTVGGLMVGDVVHEYIKNFDAEFGNPKLEEGQVQEQREVAFAPTKVNDGIEALEIESAIRYICDRYSGMYRSEGKLLEGLRRLSSLRKYWMHKVSAPNPHYMLSWLELRNLMDVAELHMIASLERKETRGNYIRMDYPEMNPELDKMTVQRLEKGKIVTEFRKMPELDNKYDEVDVGIVKPERVKQPWGQLF